MKNQKIVPCLWFEKNIEEAVRFYTSTFKNSKVTGTTRYTKASAKASGHKQGDTLTVIFEIEGLKLMALNGGPFFKISPANSFFVACKDLREIDSLWEKLSQGGTARMPLQKYPFAEKYGWIEDRFGVNWQLMVSDRAQKVSPALLFTNEKVGKCEDAIMLYTSLFDSSEIETMHRDHEGKLILHARFSLAGQSFVAMEGPGDHPFTFTPAISFVANCENQNEIDRLWKNLSSIKEAEQCGWCVDRFGVSWQIVPRILGEILLENDEAKSERVAKAFLQMKKFDLDKIKHAAAGGPP